MKKIKIKYVVPITLEEVQELSEENLCGPTVEEWAERVYTRDSLDFEADSMYQEFKSELASLICDNIRVESVEIIEE